MLATGRRLGLLEVALRPRLFQSVSPSQMVKAMGWVGVFCSVECVAMLLIVGIVVVAAQ